MKIKKFARQKLHHNRNFRATFVVLYFTVSVRVMTSFSTFHVRLLTKLAQQIELPLAVILANPRGHWWGRPLRLKEAGNSGFKRLWTTAFQLKQLPVSCVKVSLFLISRCFRFVYIYAVYHFSANKGSYYINVSLTGHNDVVVADAGIMLFSCMFC